MAVLVGTCSREPDPRECGILALTGPSSSQLPRSRPVTAPAFRRAYIDISLLRLVHHPRRFTNPIRPPIISHKRSRSTSTPHWIPLSLPTVRRRSSPRTPPLASPLLHLTLCNVILFFGFVSEVVDEPHNQERAYDGADNHSGDSAAVQATTWLLLLAAVLTWEKDVNRGLQCVLIELLTGGSGQAECSWIYSLFTYHYVLWCNSRGSATHWVRMCLILECVLGGKVNLGTRKNRQNEG